MNDSEIKEILCKQLKLLAEASAGSVTPDELRGLSDAMVSIAECIRCIDKKEVTYGVTEEIIEALRHRSSEGRPMIAEQGATP